MKKYLFLGLILLAFSNVQAQVQRLQKPLSKKTIQALPETFVVLDTATYNQLFQKLKSKTDVQDKLIGNQRKIIENQEEIIKNQNEVIKNLQKESEQLNKIHELQNELTNNQKRQIELMQKQIETLQKQLAEKNKKK